MSELSGGAADGQALLNRARAGVLKAKAAFLNIEGDARPDVILQPGFWDWDRYTEAEERWETGDFSATIEGLRHDAIAVAFDLTGLSELLPAEQRPELARKVSVAGDPAWCTATAARAFMYNELDAQPMKAAALLLDQCRLGFVAARAVLRRQADDDEPNRWSIEEREWDIPLWFWESFTGRDNSSQDWERGVFAGKGLAPFGRCWITLSGVHFSKASLRAMLPTSGIGSTPENPPTPAPGGRPPAAFWDDLWCAIWGKIYRGELMPERQADVERAMLDWASDNGHDLSETAARARARKLFAECGAEGKNPPH